MTSYAAKLSYVLIFREYEAAFAAYLEEKSPPFK
jgi:hypothetical protein